jgi:hypothetical protein
MGGTGRGIEFAAPALPRRRAGGPLGLLYKLGTRTTDTILPPILFAVDLLAAHEAEARRLVLPATVLAIDQAAVTDVQLGPTAFTGVHSVPQVL